MLQWCTVIDLALNTDEYCVLKTFLKNVRHTGSRGSEKTFKNILKVIENSSFHCQMRILCDQAWSHFVFQNLLSNTK